ncbi:YbjN domain-containing protein [Aquabacter sp. L1I39]|uniref:YbjN domain-containing protein n=1 Tax=Aquabacter sp. L1I39 TaxID=2820278 RepID=UPI001ADA7B53|nr:YbjN domain-containing protein [Aquabacter sp. L1I39]QTL05239.1 YbjN domain-containing protein [Aquabacter sp. L1I39]
MSGIIQKATFADLETALKERGFRAELIDWPGGRKALRSASGGVGFNIVPGNAVDGGFMDFTYFASFRVDGLPLEDVAAHWNRARRFSRAYTRDGFLNFEMDVVIGPGVAPAYLAVTLDLWDRLLNELLAALREQAAEQQKAGQDEATAAAT